MAYYVSAQPLGSSRTVLAVGPFLTHGAALAEVEPFAAWAGKHTREGKEGFVTFGTARSRTHHRPGHFNGPYKAESSSQ